MKGFTVYAFIALLVGALAVPQELASKWEAFKAEHGKQYSSEEDAERMQRFAESLAEIEAHNTRFAAGEESFSRQLNRYSDLSDEELDDRVYGSKPAGDEPSLTWNDPDVHSLGNSFRSIIPPEYDTEKMGYVTPVKDQKDCGSCYAFAAIALLEAHIKHRKNKTFDLSEQEAIDCTYNEYDNGKFNNGCESGRPAYVLVHAIKNGITTESLYPYTSGTSRTHGTCQANKTKADLMVRELKLYAGMSTNEEALRKLLFFRGPLVVFLAMDGQYQRSFIDLKDGIYDAPIDSNTIPNHVVLLVGYGHENNKSFWRIKNSWGTSWGNGGYGKIVRGKNLGNILLCGARYLTSR